MGQQPSSGTSSAQTSTASVGPELPVTVNEAKKAQYLESVQEVLDCCQDDNYTRLLELLTENENLARCTGRVRFALIDAVSAGYADSQSFCRNKGRHFTSLHNMAPASR
jgi:hypothetical protein